MAREQGEEKMSDTKYTPGPWVINKRVKTSINANGKHIAMVNWFRCGGHDDVFDEEHYANANLIAAAPELLDALIEAKKNLSSWGEYAPDYFKEKWNLKGDIGKIDRVIALARGEK